MGAGQEQEDAKIAELKAEQGALDLLNWQQSNEIKRDISVLRDEVKRNISVLLLALYKDLQERLSGQKTQWLNKSQKKEALEKADQKFAQIKDTLENALNAGSIALFAEKIAELEDFIQKLCYETDHNI